MNRREALRQVAEWTAATLQGGDLDEATGLDTADMSDADAERLGWAVSEVIRRLYRMGGSDG